MFTAVDQIGRIRRGVEDERKGSRADIARELSIAITHLEDAEMRLARAIVRKGRHAADAEAALGQIEDQLLDEADIEPEQEVKD